MLLIKRIIRLHFFLIGILFFSIKGVVDAGPGKELIEFMMNPPERYDFGGSQTMYWEGGESTQYFRMKKDGKNFFSANSTKDDSIIRSKLIGDLGLYRVLVSRYENEYWKISGDTLTMWTNKNIPLEATNELVLSAISTEKSMTELVSLFGCSPEIKLFKEGENFYSKNQLGEIIADHVLEYDSNNYLSFQKIIMRHPVELYTAREKTIYSLGTIVEYEYTNEETAIPFFPSKINGFNISKTVTEKDVVLKTNQVYSYQFIHLNLNPTLVRSDFEIIPSPENQLRQFWVSGTNIVFENKNSGQIERALSSDEAKILRERMKLKQKSYRHLYVTLAIFLGMAFIVIAIRRKK